MGPLLNIKARGVSYTLAPGRRHVLIAWHARGRTYVWMRTPQGACDRVVFFSLPGACDVDFVMGDGG